LCIFFFFIIRQIQKWEERQYIPKAEKTINQIADVYLLFRQNARKRQKYGQFKWLRARADAMTEQEKIETNAHCTDKKNSKWQYFQS